MLLLKPMVSRRRMQHSLRRKRLYWTVPSWLPFSRDWLRLSHNWKTKLAWWLLSSWRQSKTSRSNSSINRCTLTLQKLLRAGGTNALCPITLAPLAISKLRCRSIRILDQHTILVLKESPSPTAHSSRKDKSSTTTNCPSYPFHLCPSMCT